MVSDRAESAAPGEPCAPETMDAFVRLLAQVDPSKLGDSRNASALQAGRADLERLRDDGRAIALDPETKGAALAGVDLSGVNLSHAVLDGANLRGAILTGVVAHGADFSHTVLEATMCRDADFSGAHFSSTRAGEIDLTKAMLEDARFEHASLRYANFRESFLDAAVFTHADLWGACLEAVDADEASFRRARLDEAKMAGGNFAGADFSEASLKKTDLGGARMHAATLTGARLEGAMLARADLSQASLPRLNLLSCDLTHVRLAGTWLELTRFQAHQLGGAVGEEVEGDLLGAQQAYIGLEQNFRSLGNSDDASWAFRRRRVMGKRHEGALAVSALRERHPLGAVQHGARWAADTFVEWLCDYGESSWRVVRAFLVTILCFALLYGLTGALKHVGTDGRIVITRSAFDLVAYSFLNMLSTSAPDIGVKPVGPVVVLVSSLQGALGIVLIGLFGFVLGNKMHQ